MSYNARKCLWNAFHEFSITNNNEWSALNTVKQYNLIRSWNSKKGWSSLTLRVCLSSFFYLQSLLTTQCSSKNTQKCKRDSPFIVKTDINDKAQREVPTIISKSFLHLAFCFEKGKALSNEIYRHKVPKVQEIYTYQTSSSVWTNR